MHPHAIWRFIRTQPLSFWFVNLYMFFEYVRPQHIYRWMGTFPYASTLIYLALAAVIFEGRAFRRLVLTDYLLLAFSIVIVLSSVQALSPPESYHKFPQFFGWVLAYVIITSAVNTERRYFVFTVAFLLYSFKMSQHGARSWIENGFGFSGWGATGAPGWFQNSGEFGIQMAIFFPIVAHVTAVLRKRWNRIVQVVFATMIVTSVMSIMASSSRGAVIALGGVIVWMVGQSRKKVKGLLLAGIVAVAVITFLPQGFRDRFDTIGEDKTSIARKEYWAFGKQLMREHPVLGIGYENWLGEWRRTHGYPALSHNIYIQAGAELGYVGLATFIALILGTLVVNWRTRRAARRLGEDGRFLVAMAFGLDAAMVGFLVAGTFVTVLYYPFFWINLAMTTALHRAALHSVSRARQAARAAVAEGPPPPLRLARAVVRG